MMLTEPGAWIAALTAGGLCAALLALALPWARRIALVDKPGAHKTHSSPVPTIGGPAIIVSSAVALVGAMSVGGVERIAHWPALAGSVLLLLAVGIADDRRSLSPALRFAAQIATAIVMILYGKVVLHDFGDLLQPQNILQLGFLEIPVTVFCAVGVMNAINMIDGMDGLAGSIAFLVLFAIALLAAANGLFAQASLALIVAGASLAFVAYNVRLRRRPALVYLGNGGSLAVGFVIAWLLIGLSQDSPRAFAPVIALWLLAVPLIDTVSVMWRRVSDGRSPFKADHTHLHHLFLRAGFSVPVTLAILVGTQTACMIAGVVMSHVGVPSQHSAIAFLAVAFVFHVFAGRAARGLPSMPSRLPT
jgi:UDP-GlcNAc:undecaprenyl-phosphate/decaprenyl-phosphate GlcNAc-1-phosphate transferase